MESDNKYIIFQLDNQLYGATIEQVISIEKLVDITALPKMPSYVEGVVHLRGVITPIIDMKKLLQISNDNYSDEAKIMIVTIGENQIGLLIDFATDVLNIESGQVESTPSVAGEPNRALITGLANIDNRIITLLNFDYLFSEKDREEIAGL